MLFSKNKKVDLVTLKTESPEIYNDLIADVRTAIGAEDSKELLEANAKIVELTQKTERKEIDDKITEYGKSLKVETVAKACIEAKMSLAEALPKLLDSHIKGVKDTAESFKDTASAAAGANIDDDDSNVSKPKTFVEAIRIVSLRDKCTKAEAATKAQKEYKELFDAQYEDLPKLEEDEG